VVFQESVLDRGLSGRRNLEIHARLWGLDAATTRHRIGEVAEIFSLAVLLDRQASTYSGGERRRLEIARALLSRPRVLFLDEPSVGLDPRIRQELLDSIAQLRATTDTTILLTTHYLDEADRLCDRVGIMHDGRIVAVDSPAALRDRLGRELVEVRVAGDAGAALDALRLQDLAGGDAFAVGSTITLPVHHRTAGETIDAINEVGLATNAITSRAPTLDDVYVRLTGERIAA
jgi:ABC-2 type transport system ATP-binding protein